jgi:hypothetical protein
VLERRRDDAVDVVGLPHVGLDEDGGPAAGLGQGLGLVAAADDDVGAGGEEALGDAPSDATAPTGDDDGPAGVVEGIALTGCAHPHDRIGRPFRTALLRCPA